MKNKKDYRKKKKNYNEKIGRQSTLNLYLDSICIVNAFQKDLPLRDFSFEIFKAFDDSIQIASFSLSFFFFFSLLPFKIGKFSKWLKKKGVMRAVWIKVPLFIVTQVEQKKK